MSMNETNKRVDELLAQIEINRFKREIDRLKRYDLPLKIAYVSIFLIMIGQILIFIDKCIN